MELKDMILTSGNYTFKIIPGSSKNMFCWELQEWIFKIKISTPPVDGAANKWVIDFLSQQLEIKKQNITIISWKKGAIKRIFIQL